MADYLWKVFIRFFEKANDEIHRFEEKCLIYVFKRVAGLMVLFMIFNAKIDKGYSFAMKGSVV
jgi:hypothetical protein